MKQRQQEPPRGDFVDAILSGVTTDDGEAAPWQHKVFVMVDMLAGGLATTTLVMLYYYAAAARDPGHFEDPHQLDIDRKMPTNIAFGYGPHRCFGSHLARLQAVTTLEVLLRRMPDMRLADGQEPAFSHSTVTRDVTRLPIVFTPGRRVQDET